MFIDVYVWSMVVRVSQKINLLLLLHPHPFLLQLPVQLVLCHFEHLIAHHLRNGPVLPLVLEHHSHLLLFLPLLLLPLVVAEMGLLEELGSLVRRQEWK